MAIAPSTSKVNVITVNHVFSLLDLTSQQPDVADVMLRATVMTTGDVNVERQVEVKPLLQRLRDLHGVSFCVGAGKLAAGTSRARDQSRREAAGLVAEPDRDELVLDRFYVAVIDVRKNQILPNREADFAVAVVLGNVGE